MKSTLMAILLSLAMIGSVKWNFGPPPPILKPAEKPEIQYITKQRDVLKGLEGIYVVVYTPNPELDKYGLTKQIIQTDVELRLRQYGISVLTEEQWQKTLGSPILYVKINSAINKEFGWVAIGIHVDLIEGTFLARKSTTCCSSTTWGLSNVWLGGTNDVKMAREGLTSIVDVFINDHLAANPKEQSE